MVQECGGSYREIFERIVAALGVSREFKEVSPSTLGLLAKLDSFLGFFTRKRRITSEHVQSAFNKSLFSSEKVKEALGMEFTPISEVIEGVARFYRKDFPLKK